MTDQHFSHCPTAEAIWQYAAGEFDDARSEELETHLLSCPQCETVLDGLDDPSDAVIQALATLPVLPEDEAAYQTVRANVLAMPAEFSGSAEASDILQRVSRLADPELGPLPCTLGNYELLACIGRGASGAVYRARHLKLDQTVAVKVLDESRSSAAEAFFQEMKTIGSLAHPNIVRATDAGEADGLHFLVMEYVDGIDAARLLFRHGPLRVADACELVRQASLGLQFIHQRSLVHRDIKPSNLLVTADGQVKLLDLGIAIATDLPNHDSKPQGTLDYMPPELWKSSEAISASGDIYSLGVTLFKLLTGSLPKSSTDQASDFRSDVPRAVDGLVQRMLASSPEDRPAGLPDIVNELLPRTRSANLQQLVEDACPDVATRTKSAAARTPLLSRRTAVAGALAASLSAIAFSKFRFQTGPQLRRTDWRPLVPESPKLLLADGNADDVQLDADVDGQIQLASTALALLHLGRPVSGTFQLQVFLQADSAQQCGVFFQGRTDYLAEDPVLRFQTIALNSDTSISKIPMQRTLLWSQWTAEKTESGIKLQRVPLAEIPVQMQSSSQGQHLRVTCGRQGMPEIEWNKKPLHESLWHFAAEARPLQRMSAGQLPTAYLGRLGLVNSLGSTTFSQPQLAYL